MTPPPPDRGWWQRRSLRARLALSSAIPLAVALVVGTVAVGAAFSGGRVADLDRQTGQELDALTGLLSSGQLPSTLPSPPGSALLGQVVGADGAVLAATPSASRVLPLLPDPVPDRVGTEEDGAYTGEPLRYRTQTVVVSGRRLTVVVATPLLGVRHTLHALFLILLLVVPLLLVLTTALIWRVTGLALRPVERLRVAAAAFSGEPESLIGTGGPRRPDGEPPLPVLPGDDELARLSRTLNELLTALATVLGQQRQFLADAAHELRSPLASMQVQLDVARAHPTSTDGAALVRDLQPEVLRLSRLTDDLLLLARFEAGGQRGVERLDLTALSGARGPAVEVAGDASALGRLIDNLTSNAGRYAERVDVWTDIVDGWAVLVVDDDGPGIPPADRLRVFDRWVRLDQSRARTDGGAGLGLALVREITRSHGGDVRIESSPLGGTRVRVQLPRWQDPDRDRT